METIVEEDEKDVKMYERESIQSKQNIKEINIICILKKK